MSTKAIIVVISIVAAVSYFAGCQLAVHAKAGGPQNSTSPQTAEYNVFPLPSRYPLTSTFYDSIRSDGTTRLGRQHWDIACPANTEVLSPCDGEVIEWGWMPDIGNHIYIRDNQGNINRFGHFRARDWHCIVKGQKVYKGQLIGYSGGSDAARGHSSGAHLHWQIFDSKGVPICPTDYLKR